MNNFKKVQPETLEKATMKGQQKIKICEAPPTWVYVSGSLNGKKLDEKIIELKSKFNLN